MVWVLWECYNGLIVDSSVRKIEEYGIEKVGGTKFSEWGLPGVENVPTPLESVFILSRGP